MRLRVGFTSREDRRLALSIIEDHERTPGRVSETDWDRVVTRKDGTGTITVVGSKAAIVKMQDRLATARRDR
jgi:hypothetical protein